MGGQVQTRVAGVDTEFRRGSICLRSVSRGRTRLDCCGGRWDWKAESLGFRGIEMECIVKGKKGFWYEKKGRSVVRPGNCSIRGLLEDTRFTQFVLGFLSSTSVGKLKRGCLELRG